METKEITTPIGKNKVKLKAYITGKDAKEINAVLLDNIEISSVGQKLSGSNIVAMTDKQMDLIVLEVDGKTENTRDLVENMVAKDYNFVVTEVQKIADYQDKKKEL